MTMTHQLRYGVYVQIVSPTALRNILDAGMADYVRRPGCEQFPHERPIDFFDDDEWVVADFCDDEWVVADDDLV